MNADGSNVRRLTFNAHDFDGRCDWQRLCTINGSGNILGTEGDDVIGGSPGPDRILGLGGNDILLGFGGDDSLDGGAGNDTLFGGIGNDALLGQAGTDFSSGGPGADPGDACYIGGAPAACPPRRRNGAVSVLACKTGAKRRVFHARTRASVSMLRRRAAGRS